MDGSLHLFPTSLNPYHQTEIENLSAFVKIKSFYGENWQRK